MTWNNGTPGSWVTYTLPGSLSAGDQYVIALQVGSAVTSSGYYPYVIDLEADFSSAPTQVTRQVAEALSAELSY